MKFGWILSIAVLTLSCMPTMPGQSSVTDEATLYQLTQSQLQVTVSLSHSHPEQLAVSIDDIENADKEAFAVLVFAGTGENPQLIHRLSPFPADQLGCYGIRVSADITQITVRLQAIDDRELPSLVELRVIPLEQC